MNKQASSPPRHDGAVRNCVWIVHLYSSRVRVESMPVSPHRPQVCSAGQKPKRKAVAVPTYPRKAWQVQGPFARPIVVASRWGPGVSPCHLLLAPRLARQWVEGARKGLCVFDAAGAQGRNIIIPIPRPCLVHPEIQKVFKISRHIESCGRCMKH